MYIHRIRSGSKKQFLKLLLRESYRTGSLTKQRTLANLSSWERDDIKLLEQALKARRTTMAGSETAAAVETLIYSLVATKVTTSKPHAAYQILASLRRPHGSNPLTGQPTFRGRRKAIANQLRQTESNWRPVSTERQIELCEPVTMQK